MQNIIDTINKTITVAGVPGTALLLVTLIILLAFIFKRLLSLLIQKYLRKLVLRIDESIDTSFIDKLHKPLGWLVILGGCWLAYMSLSPYLAASLAEFTGKALNFGVVLMLATSAHRASMGVASIFKVLAKRSKTEVDNVLVPYIPKFVQIMAILLVGLKGAELFLGMSPTALVGLLGGAGLTIGLIFKDVADDWLAGLIIFADRIYTVDDLVETPDGLGYVKQLGLRSTTLHMQAGPIIKITNSDMLNNHIRNWSTVARWQLSADLRLDGVPAATLKRVLDGVRDILSRSDVSHDDSMVFLNKLDGNSRVISMEYYPEGKQFFKNGQLDDGAYYEHWTQTVEQVNLDILALLEDLEIDHLAVMLFKQVKETAQT